MTSLDDMCRSIAGRLDSGTPLQGVTRVEYSCYFRGDVRSRRAVLLLRTDEVLAAQMMAVAPYQVPNQLVDNSVAIWTAARDYLEQGTMELMGGETMHAAAIGLDTAQALGVVIDRSTGITTFPEVRLPTSEAETQARGEAFNHGVPDWGYALLASSGKQHDVAPWWLQVMHIPDRPLYQLNDATLGRSFELAIGWNYGQMYGPAFMANAHDMMCDYLTKATTLIRYA